MIDYHLSYMVKLVDITCTVFTIHITIFQYQSVYNGWKVPINAFSIIIMQLHKCDIAHQR